MHMNCLFIEIHMSCQAVYSPLIKNNMSLQQSSAAVVIVNFKGPEIDTKSKIMSLNHTVFALYKAISQLVHFPQ